MLNMTNPWGKANENHDEIPLTPIRMAANNTITKQKTAGAGEDVQKVGFSYTAGGNEKWCRHDGEHWRFFKKCK